LCFYRKEHATTCHSSTACCFWAFANAVTAAVASLSADEVLACTAVVRNTGNVRLSGLSITGDGSCTPDNQPLLPDATTSCIVTKASSQDDFEAGGMTLAVSASATGSGTNATLASASTTATVELQVRRELELTLARTDNTTVVDKADAVAHLSLTAANRGNTHLRNVTLDMPGLADVACFIGDTAVTLPANLLVGAGTIVCSGAFTFDQDALEGGSRNFSAAGSAANLGGPGAASNSVEVVVAASPGLQLDVDALNCTRAPRMRE
jgi:hypothetical protein